MIRGGASLKFRRYLAVLLLVLTIAAIGMYLYRDSIARDVANAVLKDSDFVVTGLSIDSIGTENIFFNELVLEQSDGTRIRVSGIALPIKTARARSDVLSVDSIEIISASMSERPAAIAAILTSILELPPNVPFSAVRISRVITDRLPQLTNVYWESTNAGQLLRFDIGSFAVVVGIDQVSDVEHRVFITATASDDIIAVALALLVKREKSGFAVSGQSTTRTTPIMPVLHAVGMMPITITSIDTLLRGVVNTFIPDNPNDPLRIEATLKSDGEMSLQYQIDEQSQLQVRVLTYSPTIITVEYPSMYWRAQIESGDMRITIASVQDFPLSVASLDCRSGIKCSLQANVVANDFSLGGLSIGSAAITVPVTITVDQQTQVKIAGNATAVFRGLSNQESAAELIELTAFSGATIDLDDNGWHGVADEAHFLIDGIDAQPGLRGSMQLVLSNLAINDSGNEISSAYLIRAANAQLSFAEFSWSMPDFEGIWQLAIDDFSARVKLPSADNAVRAQMQLTHNLATGQGTIQIQDASWDFSSRHFSTTLLPAPKNWDINAGRASLVAALAWSATDQAYEVTGSTEIRLDDISGFKDDIALTGLTTALNVKIDTQSGHEYQPGTLSLDLIEVGLPLSEITADFQIGADLSSVQVNALSMQVLGGTARADPFNYEIDADINAIVLRLDSIQLSFMESLAAFDRVDIEGSISGVLPVRLVGDQITIDRGQLENDNAGGFIRYNLSDDGADDSTLGVATRALSNFEFESLASNVTYTEDGDLLLSMRLEGINPELDPNQPVILNLNLESNIPRMLRSMRATRSIEEIFQRRLNKE